MKPSLKKLLPALQRFGRSSMAKVRRDLTQEERDDKQEKKQQKKSLLKPG